MIGISDRQSRVALALVLMLGGVVAGCNRSGGQATEGSGGPATSPSATQPAPYGGDRSPPAAYASRNAPASDGGYEARADRPPPPLFHGEPMWSENRRHTAQENAEYHFERAGQDLGAKTLDDFLTKVHAFGDHPPAGTLSMTRTNGDKLLYDPRANLFGVFTRQGAPRTVFKPTTGMDYWKEQQAREASGDSYGGRSYGARRYGGSGGGGDDSSAPGGGGADQGG